jgi:DNA repair protein RecN (Recombination protein N)
LFGERADKNIIRSNEVKCELSATLKIPDYAATEINKILSEYSIPVSDDREILLRRVITQNASRQFINDTSATLNMLESLSNLLIDFHGPDQHQSLLKNSSILDMIDSFGRLSESREQCEKLYNTIKNTEEEIAQLEESLPNQNEIEYYKHLIHEIKTTNPGENEDIALNSRYNFAVNCKNIIETATNAKNRLYDSEESVYNILGNINRKLSDISRLDPENANKFTDCVSTITSQIKDLSYDLENYFSKIDLNGVEYAELEARLNLISGLKRRYGPTIKDVLNNLHSAENKLYLYENSTSIVQKLSENMKDSELATISNLSERRAITDAIRFPMPLTVID